MSTNKAVGRLGYGAIPDAYAFIEAMNNRVVQGCMAKAPTNASTQASGDDSSDYNIDMTTGLLALDGTVEELAAAADIELENTSGSAAMAAGQSRWYAYVRYKSLADGVKRTLLVKGTVAADASVVRVTDAEIEAKLADNTPYVRIFDAKANRSADTTVVITWDNTVRPTLCLDRSDV
jgi:hypothetical protein